MLNVVLKNRSKYGLKSLVVPFGLVLRDRIPASRLHSRSVNVPLGTISKRLRKNAAVMTGNYVLVKGWEHSVSLFQFRRSFQLQILHDWPDTDHLNRKRVMRETLINECQIVMLLSTLLHWTMTSWMGSQPQLRTFAQLQYPGFHSFVACPRQDSSYVTDVTHEFMMSLCRHQMSLRCPVPKPFRNTNQIT
jgi:hypothetical protein